VISEHMLVISARKSMLLGKEYKQSNSGE